MKEAAKTEGREGNNEKTFQTKNSFPRFEREVQYICDNNHFGKYFDSSNSLSINNDCSDENVVAIVLCKHK
jgi:hypothetical protein